MKNISYYLLLGAVFGLFFYPLRGNTENEYSVLPIYQWNVHVQKILLTSEKELGDKVLRLLKVKLFDINRVVPSEALSYLHQVPIWIDLNEKAFPCCVYHPSAEWLKEHGFDPQKARAVHISNAKNFLTWTLDQPSMILHEMAHAYHHQVLGYDHSGIKEAFHKAVQSKKYESVMRYNGKRVKAYALNNEQEYFAELTEAFFGVNDFYPFVRAEVKEHDPGMYTLLETVWNEKQEKNDPFNP